MIAERMRNTIARTPSLSQIQGPPDPRSSVGRSPMRPPEQRSGFKSALKAPSERPQIKIIYLRKDKKGNFIFKVHPQDVEITRSVNDIYSLRQSLVLEFPFYYVPSPDSPGQGKGQQGQLCQHLF
jgi:hypothetical protein